VDKTDGFARQTVNLPGPVKQAIAVCADAIMMPLVLWAALSLKGGAPVFSMADWPAYVAVVVVSTLIFVRFGLYRAVIRFLGHQAVFAVTFCVVYAYRADWRDPISRHVFTFIGCIAAVLVLSIIRLVTGAQPDSGWFAWLRTLVFLGIPFSLGERLWILLTVRDGRHDRPPSHRR